MIPAQAMSELVAGLLLGLGLIMPIGAQNLFIVQQGISLGAPRVFYATLATTCCDALLIAAGSLGLGTLFAGHDILRSALMAVGGAYLLYLAWQNLRRPDAAGLDGQRAAPLTARRTITRAMGVSLLNPHAILDTVGVIGAVGIARDGAARVWFAAGCVLASLVWFTLLGTAALAVRHRLTGRGRLWIARVSSAVMAFFALLLWSELALA
ncbi:LysE family transporter [Streptomyces sp. NPDC048483]|uniref:LysE/ArgO family amino acid transporter n=1 Tax=Streptomyces sp. NPDC048483 TaxID=3154927 RepID=UPI003427F1DD